LNEEDRLRVTNDPSERLELMSSAFAQALTALSFGYKSELFVMDNGVRVLEPECVAGHKARTFDPLSELILYYKNMGGQLNGCNPSIVSRNINTETFRRDADGFVNASKLLESAVKADAVYT